MTQSSSTSSILAVRSLLVAVKAAAPECMALVVEDVLAGSEAEEMGIAFGSDLEDSIFPFAGLSARPFFAFLVFFFLSFDLICQHQGA